ncbi:MAG: 50S ribosomal protein L6 [Candidatus Accumulibacter phosphatis]|uniref:Large ribosomal subunit protein uL6 n=1 Tax=Candidatus Accumulibacter cognatus TaxID=2954383 RepID=A0A080ML23_9PROT|nr:MULTISPECIES: 50S ribosomal protein L6 [Candidatus Accumulibacter]KFB78314.1 MAG: 50S ribosomal protein L6 [Candidatus Accumulibacter cognatus]MBN8516751.1 50S ribosomal protein L6 [Accumulibacter sp.]MBO3710039.1 50S ribosomal protein L6 [Accumulibacter sp.]MCC2869499.1 50S ribosomal protein L6 [Candidatus Accumulibacter phosphatis]MCM8579212.1 50S ribosomal protein L6 [Accumulibacter sp.]
MSRVAKKPIVLPPGVTVDLSAELISVKGPLGALDFSSHAAVTIEQEGDSLLCKPVEGVAQSDALSGTMRAVIANMVTGVSKGFERKLSLVGVGYRAQVQGDTLNLSLGFSHPVVYQLPQGINATVPTQTEIVIKGVDRQLVGQVAAEVRAYRKPEPYKGKGVRYAEEVVVIKETKKKK